MSSFRVGEKVLIVRAGDELTGRTATVASELKTVHREDTGEALDVYEVVIEGLPLVDGCDARGVYPWQLEKLH